MPRLHLIELHEQAWMPSLLRDCVTDYLRTATKVAGQYDLIQGEIQSMLLATGAKEILDLGSGAGAGWPELQPQLSDADGHPVRVILSDMSPNLPAWKKIEADSGGQISYLPGSTDARKPGRAGFRTLFNVFHHFRPADARAIVEDADRQQQPFIMVEAMDKSWIQGIMIVLLAPIMTLLLTPAIRPFRWGRILFTYLIPIVPLMVAWDGMVSVIRLYSIRDLEAMTRDLNGLIWQAEKIRKKGLVLMVLKGMPREKVVE